MASLCNYRYVITKSCNCKYKRTENQLQSRILLWEDSRYNYLSLLLFTCLIIWLNYFFAPTTETANPSWLKVNGHPLFFYDGDCNDPNVQTRLKESFLNKILKSRLVPPFFCVFKPDECNLNTIELFCGAVSAPEGRRKRSSVRQVCMWMTTVTRE